jgi:hypothetical protein
VSWKKWHANDDLSFPIMAVMIVMIGVLQATDDFVADLKVAFLFGFLAQLVLVALVLSWGISIQVRIVAKDMRYVLVTSVAFLLFWLVVRYAKYAFFNYDETIRRYLWYAYYIPQLVISPLSLYIAFHLGCVSSRPVNRKWFLLAIPSLLLVVLIFTNDFHQLAFRFRPHFEDWSSTYAHGPIFSIVMVYNIIALLIEVIVGYLRCRVSSSRKKLWIPLLFLFLGVVLNWYEYAYGLDSFNMPELFCFTFILVIESCIDIGFIPSNTQYRELFEQSDLCAVIVDKEGDVILSSRQPLPFDREDMRRAAEKPFLVTPDLRLTSMPVSGGSVFWTDDLSQINRLNGELSDISSQLSEEHELITANASMEELRASLEKKQLLLDRINNVTDKEIRSIRSLLDDGEKDKKRNLMHVCVLEAYVKRRSNLEILLDAGYVSYGELDYCIGESLQYLKAYGVNCFYKRKEGSAGNGFAVVKCYEQFERIIEDALPGLTDLLVHVESDGKLVFLKMVMEHPTKATGGEGVSISTDEGTTYVMAVAGGEQ